MPPPAPVLPGPSTSQAQARDTLDKAPGKQSVANSDGWQWRKYGEKIVKGSPNPRSYYKCSHTGCTAKKIVERNAAGDLLATEYKGDHCHPAPASVKIARSKPRTARLDNIVVEQVEPAVVMSSAPQPQAVGVASPGLLPIPDALRMDLHGAGCSTYDDEEEDLGAPQPQLMRDNSTDAPRHGIDAAAIIRRIQEQQANNDSPSKRLDVLAAFAEEAERQFNESTSSELQSAKRMRVEPGSPDATAPDSRTRVILADTAEDGFRWRKYGQKFVRGSQFPRSYFKCSYAGCSARKHVERSAFGAQLAITYEGVHNHQAPSYGPGRAGQDDEYDE